MAFALFYCVLLAFGASVFAAPTFDEGNRIVNGTDAFHGEFPFAVSLRYSANHRHTCGGSILSPDWILTAAHCSLGSTNPAYYEVQYGVLRIDAYGPNVITVAEIHVHEYYAPGNQYENDIAVMRLESPMHFSPFVGRVNLPARMQDTQGRLPATLIGWGLDETGGVIQEILQRVSYYISPQDECREIHYATIHDSNICGFYPGGGKGQCSGDSGGPLLVNGQQVGVVSWSVKPCAIGPYPGVLTRVSHYIDWLAETTGLDL